MEAYSECLSMVPMPRVGYNHPLRSLLALTDPYHDEPIGECYILPREETTVLILS
jgi:hypothetical protein